MGRLAADAKGALDFAFIFEDDAQIDANTFAALLEFMTLERPAWDYVLLPATPIRNGTPVARRDDLTLMRPDAPPLRAIAQVVSLAAAERLLDRTLVRSAHRHVHANDLGHRPAGAGRLAFAGPRRFSGERRQHRSAQVDEPH